MKSFSFCNNCGKSGHIFQSCTDPITSVGVIAFKKEDDIIKYLMICRKHTLGYLDFLRGRYNILHIAYIKTLIDIMTLDEKANLLNYDFDTLWKNLWGNNIGVQYRGEETSAKTKFTELKNTQLKHLLNNSVTNWKQPEWGFPKGRRNYQERDLYCALREFTEETGYNSATINLITNLTPYEEIFIGSNNKCYKHKYFVGLIDNSIEPEFDFQDTEVSMVEWKTFEECNNHIRDYNLEKVEILEKINTFLCENNLCI